MSSLGGSVLDKVFDRVGTDARCVLRHSSVALNVHRHKLRADLWRKLGRIQQSIYRNLYDKSSLI